MDRVKDELNQIWKELPEGVRLVAISKYHPKEAIEEAYAAGQRVFGENHVQELMSKESVLPEDIEWHFTGHLQTNKVKYIAPFISLIHSVDSEKLLREINKQGAKAGRIIPCLIELHVAKEESKFGFTADELDQLFGSGIQDELPYVEIQGLMAMATNTDDEQRIEEDFALAYDVFLHLKSTWFKDSPAFKELSMGMSHDYHLALRHHTTMVRIGTRIFGERVY